MKQAFISVKQMRGFSLLELLVSIAISSLLLMGVVALFISSRQSYETTERLSRIQENGRYALDQFANDVRSVGYQGCARVTPGSSRAQEFAINTLRNPTSLLWNMAVPAQGFNGLGGTTWSPAVAATDLSMFNPQPIGEADILVLRMPKRDARAVRLLQTQANPEAALRVGNISPEPFDAGDVAVISDCLARAWFEVSDYDGNELTHLLNPAAPGSPGNAMASLLHPFQIGAEIVPMTTVVYYLSPSPNSTADKPLMSLWRKTGGLADSDEIAEGIDRLEVQFGVDTNADGRVDAYRDASTVTSWDSVYSVQVALLARSAESYGTDLDTRTYTLLASPTAIQAGPFNDRHQRQVFTATVAVRNQIID